MEETNVFEMIRNVVKEQRYQCSLETRRMNTGRDIKPRIKSLNKPKSISPVRKSSRLNKPELIQQQTSPSTSFSPENIDVRSISPVFEYLDMPSDYGGERLLTADDLSKLRRIQFWKDSVAAGVEADMPEFLLEKNGIKKINSVANNISDKTSVSQDVVILLSSEEFEVNKAIKQELIDSITKDNEDSRKRNNNIINGCNNNNSQKIITRSAERKQNSDKKIQKKNQINTHKQSIHFLRNKKITSEGVRNCSQIITRSKTMSPQKLKEKNEIIRNRTVSSKSKVLSCNDLQKNRRKSSDPVVDLNDEEKKRMNFLCHELSRRKNKIQPYLDNRSRAEIRTEYNVLNRRYRYHLRHKIKTEAVEFEQETEKRFNRPRNSSSTQTNPYILATRKRTQKDEILKDNIKKRSESKKAQYTNVNQIRDLLKNVTGDEYTIIKSDRLKLLEDLSRKYLKS